LFKAKVVLASEDGKDWHVCRVDYVTEQRANGKFDFSDETILFEGTVLRQK
jgi:hypothetical protein